MPMVRYLKSSDKPVSARSTTNCRKSWQRLLALNSGLAKCARALPERLRALSRDPRSVP